MCNKMKICYAISSLSNQGPPNVLFNIIQYMNFEKFDVSIITMVPEQAISRFDEFRELPIEVYQLSPDKFLNPVKMFFELKRQIDKINPDIIHTHCHRSLWLVPFLSKKYKKVHTIHIYPGYQQEVMYGSLKGRLIVGLENFFTSKMDLPIGCAESVGTLYKENKGWDITCIPNGSSLSIWEGNLAYKKELRHKLGLKDDVRYFIFIGRFSKEKNPDFLIQAIKKLNRKDIGIVLLGNGPLWEQLKLEEDDKIIIPGFKSNVYDYLIASDFYISASDVEGLANTLLESMTVGLPVLLSDIPSHREVLSKTDKMIGFIFDNRNIDDLIAKIEEILLIDLEQISLEIQSIFNRYYTARQMSISYQGEYMKLLNRI